MTKDTKLKIGDIVKLKSGSPKMTVIHVYEDNIRCTWFDSKSIKDYVFAEPMLKKK